MVEFKRELRRKGAYAEVTCERSRTFDIAFSQERAYLIKIVTNIEGLSRDVAEDLAKSASVINAEPIVISDHGKGALKEGVVYRRHGVPVMRKETFLRLTRGEHVSLADRGGVKIPIKGLRELREEVRMSRNSLAKLLGVSIEMVRKYEECMAEPGEEVARRLVEIFGEKVLAQPSFEREGLKRAAPMKAPFDLAIRKKKAVLISFKDTRERVRDLKKVSEVLDAEPVVGEPDKVF